MFRGIRFVLILTLLLTLNPSNVNAHPHDGQSGRASALPAAMSSGTHHLSLPAGAFVAADDGFNFENHGRYQFLYDNPSDTVGSFSTPVQLPQGAVITKMTFYFRDPGSGTASAALLRNAHYTVNLISMLTIDSIDMWAVNFGSVSSSAFTTGTTIDNTLYEYLIIVTLPEGGLIWNCGVVIDYTLPSAPPPQVASIPPAGFTPFYDNQNYSITSAMTHNSGPGSTNVRGWYLTPLRLPDRSAITLLTFYWYRIDATEAVNVYLQRSSLGQDNYETLATLHSATGSGGFLSADTTSTIINNLVDNDLYSYWLLYDLPAAAFIGNYSVGLDTEVEYTTLPVTRKILTIPAAAFHPYEDGYDYENHGRHLIHQHGPGNSLTNGWYIAPVHLPDGVRINTLRFYYFENSSVAGVARLQRTLLGTGNYEELATVTTSIGSNSNGSSIDNTIQGGQIDNSRYAYWLVWDLPANAVVGHNVEGQAVKIEYSFQTNLPLLKR